MISSSKTPNSTKPEMSWGAGTKPYNTGWSRREADGWRELWTASLSPAIGHEQAGKRPVLVVSTNPVNQSPADLIFVLPLTCTNRGIPFHIELELLEGGLKPRSYILCDAIRSIIKSNCKQ